MRYFYFIFLVFALVGCQSDQPHSTFEKFEKGLHSSGLKLFIQDDNWQKVSSKRKEALQIGHHFKSDSDRVSAIVEINNDRYPIKIRLKGDELDHLEGDYWSFQLKAKDPIFGGHRKVGIQDPATKNILLEWLFMKIAASEGLLGLDYMFFSMKINDGKERIYAMEAIPDNSLLENSNRPLGPLLKFDENEYWSAFMTQEDGMDSVEMLKAKIKCINKKWRKQTPENRLITTEAIELLDQYRRRKISSRDCFDYEMTAKYVALSELFGTRHNLRWINLRWYYQPQKKKFEPIAFDCFDGKHPRTTVVWYNKEKRFEYFLHPLLDDPQFKFLVEKHLRRYASDHFLVNSFHNLHGDITKNVALLKQNEPGYFFDQEILIRRAAYLKAYLSK